MVRDLRRARSAPLTEHQTRASVGLDPQPADIDAVATQPPDDRRAEAVVADPADECRAMAQPGEADRDVRLGSRHVPPEIDDLRERTLLARYERDEAFPEGDDFDGFGHVVPLPARLDMGARARSP